MSDKLRDLRREGESRIRAIRATTDDLNGIIGELAQLATAQAAEIAELRGELAEVTRRSRGLHEEAQMAPEGI